MAGTFNVLDLEQFVREYMKEYIKKSQPDMDTSENSAFDDIFVKPMISILQPIFPILTNVELKSNLKYSEFLTDDEIEDIGENNYAVYRNTGSTATALQTFGFSRVPETGITIPQGVIVSTSDGLLYSTSYSSTYSRSEMQKSYNATTQTYDISTYVTASEIGSSYNVGENTITICQTAFSDYLAYTTNAVPATGGSDSEDIESYVYRCLTYYANQHLGTRAGYERALKQKAEQLTDIKIIGYQDVGMERDTIEVIDRDKDNKIIYLSSESDPNVKYSRTMERHIGGCVDIYVRGSEYAVETISPSTNSNIICIDGPIEESSISLKDEKNRMVDYEIGYLRDGKSNGADVAPEFNEKNVDVIKSYVRDDFSSQTKTEKMFGVGEEGLTTAEDTFQTYSWEEDSDSSQKYYYTVGRKNTLAKDNLCTAVYKIADEKDGICISDFSIVFAVNTNCCSSITDGAKVYAGKIKSGEETKWDEIDNKLVISKALVEYENYIHRYSYTLKGDQERALFKNEKYNAIKVEFVYIENAIDPAPPVGLTSVELRINNTSDEEIKDIKDEAEKIAKAIKTSNIFSAKSGSTKINPSCLMPGEYNLAKELSVAVSEGESSSTYTFSKISYKLSKEAEGLIDEGYDVISLKDDILKINFRKMNYLNFYIDATFYEGADYTFTCRFYLTAVKDDTVKNISSYPWWAEKGIIYIKQYYNTPTKVTVSYNLTDYGDSNSKKTVQAMKNTYTVGYDRRVSELKAPLSNSLLSISYKEDGEAWTNERVNDWCDKIYTALGVNVDSIIGRRTQGNSEKDEAFRIALSSERDFIDNAKLLRYRLDMSRILKDGEVDDDGYGSEHVLHKYDEYYKDSSQEKIYVTFEDESCRSLKNIFQWLPNTSNSSSTSEDYTGLAMQYSYNNTLHNVQTSMFTDDDRIITADVLVKEAFRTPVNVAMKIYVKNGAELTSTMRAQIRAAVNQLFSDAGINGRVEQSDIVGQLYTDPTTSGFVEYVRLALDAFYIVDEKNINEEVENKNDGDYIKADEKSYLYLNKMVIETLSEADSENATNNRALKRIFSIGGLPLTSISEQNYYCIDGSRFLIPGTPVYNSMYDAVALDRDDNKIYGTIRVVSVDGYQDERTIVSRDAIYTLTFEFEANSSYEDSYDKFYQTTKVYSGAEDI